MSNLTDADLLAAEKRLQKEDEHRRAVEQAEANRRYQTERNREYILETRRKVAKWVVAGLTVVVTVLGSLSGWYVYWGGGPAARAEQNKIEQRLEYEKSWEFNCDKAGGIPSGDKVGYYTCTFPNGAVLRS